MRRYPLKFTLRLSPKDYILLSRLAERERLPASAVLRRAIWRESGKLQTPDYSRREVSDVHIH